MWEFGQIRSPSGKASTNRAEKIFLKYFFYYYLEIALKYPREKKYSSSFYDNVSLVLSIFNIPARWSTTFTLKLIARSFIHILVFSHSSYFPSYPPIDFIPVSIF
jgi:hypothetical protein